MAAGNFPRKSPDVLIAGAGIIGLSLALELHARGAHVTVVERDSALAHASTAAAGMLAVHDPHNPPALLPLSLMSASLYRSLLARIESLSNIVVPFQTSLTHQYFPDGSKHILAENSLDPRQLAAALLAAIRATTIDLREHTPFAPHTQPTGTTILTLGAWSPHVTPRKGQMLRVQLPSALNLTEVHRSHDIYIVPRTLGPQAGTALIGSTIEDAGFDTSTSLATLASLRTLAAKLIPAFADESTTPTLEAWAGLRPATPDGLPLLGQLAPNLFIATGHFRNGILLAPATAVILADLLESKSPTLNLTPFTPTRFT